MGDWKKTRFSDFPLASSLRNSWAAGWTCKAMALAIELQEFGHAAGPSSSSCQGNSVTVYSTDAYEMRLVAGVFGPRGSKWIFLGRNRY